MATKKKTPKTRTWQGMNWCRQSTRLAIYLRDGLACVYCGATIETGAILTLDHMKPWSKGGSNKPENLVCACKRCNSARGDRPLRTFAKALASFEGLDAEKIERHVRACARRSMTKARKDAREMIALRGSAAKAIAATS